MTTSKMGIAVVTGASSGIGAIYADRLAHRGYDLMLLARSQKKLAEVAHHVAGATGRAVDVIAADLNDKSDLKRIETLLSANVGITMLVNNAGVGAIEPLLASDVDKMDAMIELNVTALTRLTYAVGPAFVARGGGTIINIASAVAIAPELLNGVYGGTKAFVLAFSLSLHKELADKNVQIQAVLPGATATKFWEVAGGSDPPTAESDGHAGGRLGRCRSRRLRSGRTRHHPLAAGCGRLGRLQVRAAEAHPEPVAQLSACSLPHRCGSVDRDRARGGTARIEMLCSCRRVPPKLGVPPNPSGSTARQVK